MLNMGSISINGTSRIDGKDVAFFGISFSGGENGNYSSSKNITDKVLYFDNQAQCDADYAEFDRMAMEYMKQIGM